MPAVALPLVCSRYARSTTLSANTAMSAGTVGRPKRSSGRQTDLSENDVRDYGLEQGLVDVKVCAVDDTWSGLAFVRRLKDR